VFDMTVTVIVIRPRAVN